MVKGINFITWPYDYQYIPWGYDGVWVCIRYNRKNGSVDSTSVSDQGAMKTYGHDINSTPTFQGVVLEDKKGRDVIVTPCVDSPDVLIVTRHEKYGNFSSYVDTVPNIISEIGEMAEAQLEEVYGV